MDMQAHRDIGVLQGKVESLERQVVYMSEKLDAIHNTITQTKGGWKLLAGAVALTATMTTILNNLGRIWESIAR